MSKIFIRGSHTVVINLPQWIGHDLTPDELQEMSEDLTQFILAAGYEPLGVSVRNNEFFITMDSFEEAKDLMQGFIAGEEPPKPLTFNEEMEAQRKVGQEIAAKYKK